MQKKYDALNGIINNLINFYNNLVLFIYFRMKLYLAKGGIRVYVTVKLLVTS